MCQKNRDGLCFHVSVRHFREFEMSTSDPGFDSTFRVSPNRTKRVFWASATESPPSAITRPTCRTRLYHLGARFAPQPATPSVATSEENRPRSGLSSGWLIAREDTNGEASGDAPRCLQLATGQWCPPAYATWFPVASAAILYASEIGREAGRSTRIIYLERKPT